MSSRNPGYKEIFSEFDILGFHNNYHKYHKRMRDYVIYFRTGSTIPYVQINGVETQLSVLIGGSLYMGVLAAPVNYPAANEGEYWRVSTAGALGAGPTVEVGDQVICIATNAGGTHAVVGASFMIVQKNMVPCDVATLRTGTDDSAFVTANCLADAFNQGVAFTDANTTLSLSGGIVSQLNITAIGSGNGIFFNDGITTGTLMAYVTISTKKSGHLFIGSMNTSILDGSFTVDTFQQLCNHDGIGSDILCGKRIIWSGNVPNGTLASSLSIYDVQYTGIYGSGANVGGDLIGIDINMQGTINDASALEYGLKVQVSSTRTGAGSVFGAYIYTNNTVTAAAYISNTNVGIHMCSGSNGIELTGVFDYGLIITGSPIYDAIKISPTLTSGVSRGLYVNSLTSVVTATLSNASRVDMSVAQSSSINMIEVSQSVLTTNTQIGTWANAISAKIDFQTNGYMTGMAGVVCAELDLPVTATASGTYTCFEAEINYPAAQVVPVSAMAINVWGANATSFDTNGLLFDINGVTEGAGNFLDAIADHAATHTIKLRIGGTLYYLLATDSLV